MGLFEKFLDVMKLNDEDDEYYDDDYEDDDEQPQERRSSRKEEPVEDDEPAAASVRITEKKSARQSSKVTPLRAGVKRNGSNEPMEVCVFKPTSFEDAKEIAETLISHQTVILNMEGVDVGLAQRIIDFSSGACYALNGNLQKISNFIFIITPHSIGISGDLQEIVNAFDFSGIQTGF